MATSYLAAQQQKLFALVDALEAELQTIESAEEIPEILQEWKKTAWKEVVEPALKTSFLNGQKTTRGGRATKEEEPAAPRRRFANWKSRIGQEEDT